MMKTLIQDALTEAIEIQIGLRALNSALNEVESGMPNVLGRECSAMIAWSGSGLFPTAAKVP